MIILMLDLLRLLSENVLGFYSYQIKEMGSYIIIFGVGTKPLPSLVSENLILVNILKAACKVMENAYLNANGVKHHI